MLRGNTKENEQRKLEIANLSKTNVKPAENNYAFQHYFI